MILLGKFCVKSPTALFIQSPQPSESLPANSKEMVDASRRLYNASKVLSAGEKISLVLQNQNWQKNCKTMVDLPMRVH